MLRVFKKNEDGYLLWLDENPNGFVFNHFGGNDPTYNLIHNAVCAFLYRPSDEGVRTNVEKVCSDDMEELTNKATELRGDTGWGYCKVCSG